LWTSDRLERRALPNSGACALCSQCTKTVDHLLAGCVYNREVWFKTLCHYGWQGVAPMANDTFVDWWLRSHKRVLKPRRKAFDSLSILLAWCLWCQRNDRVFHNNGSVPASGLSENVWSLLALWCRASLVAWLHLLGE
jgi:hypothetical protein